MKLILATIRSWSFLVLGLCLCVFSAQHRAQGDKAPVLLVVNQKDKDISFIDPLTYRQLGSISEGNTLGHGHEITVSPDGRLAYVPIYSDTGVGKPGIDGREMLVIDIASRKIVDHMDFGHPVRPHCPIYDPTSGLLYVTTELDNAVTLIDPRRLKVVGTISTNQRQSHMLAISHDGRRGYTTNLSSGSVSVLDLTHRKLLAIIPGIEQPQRISISHDDSMVFVPDQTRPRVAMIDTFTNNIKGWLTLPSIGFSTTPTQDGRWLLVALKSANKVAIVDLVTHTSVRTLDVPGAPQEIVIPSGSVLAYVSCIRGGHVAVVNISEWKLEGMIEAGAGSDGMAWVP